MLTKLFIFILKRDAHFFYGHMLFFLQNYFRKSKFGQAIDVQFLKSYAPSPHYLYPDRILRILSYMHLLVGLTQHFKNIVERLGSIWHNLS